MDDLISRQAAIELIERMKPYHLEPDDIMEIIDNMPSAQPERKRGKWVEDGYYNLPAVCCYCGEVGKRFWNFCPSCGTDMRKEVAK